MRAGRPRTLCNTRRGSNNRSDENRRAPRGSVGPAKTEPRTESRTVSRRTSHAAMSRRSRASKTATDNCRSDNVRPEKPPTSNRRRTPKGPKTQKADKATRDLSALFRRTNAFLILKVWVRKTYLLNKPLPIRPKLFEIYGISASVFSLYDYE